MLSIHLEYLGGSGSPMWTAMSIESIMQNTDARVFLHTAITADIQPFKKMFQNNRLEIITYKYAPVARNEMFGCGAGLHVAIMPGILLTPNFSNVLSNFTASWGPSVWLVQGWMDSAKMPSWAYIQPPKIAVTNMQVPPMDIYTACWKAGKPEAFASVVGSDKVLPLPYSFCWDYGREDGLMVAAYDFCPEREPKSFKEMTMWPGMNKALSLFRLQWQIFEKRLSVDEIDWRRYE